MADAEKRTGPGVGDNEPDERFEYVEEIVEYRDTRTTRILLAAILVLLALLLAYFGYRIFTAERGLGAAPVGAASKQMVWVRSIYGWGETPDKMLVAPNTVTVDADGMIWTNSNNRAAVAFNPDGSFDRILEAAPSAAATPAAGDKPGAGAAPTVTRVFSLASGDRSLFVCDNAQGTILQVTPEAGIRQSWSVPGVNKIASNGARVVALTAGSVGVFDVESGQPVFSFGKRGSKEMEFDNPWGAFIDAEGYVYVADTQNHRVRKLDPTGTLIWDAGTAPDRNDPGSMDARRESTGNLFDLPTGLTVDGNGRVIVVDAFKYQLVVLDGQTGEKIASYGDFGHDDALFNNPSAIAYDAERDYFVVADTDNNRLQVVRLPGSAKSGTRAALRRIFDRPVWICCLPFIILLIAALVLALSRRRRKREEVTEVPSVAAANGPVQAE